jgi:ribosomal-protein-alanine N-acetyltransferase
VSTIDPLHDKATAAERGAPLYRIMTAKDIPAVMVIEKQAYPYPWTEGIFRDCLRVGYQCRTLEQDGQIQAYGVISVAAGESHILNICVRPELRRQGFGRCMLGYLMDEARRTGARTMLLEVRVSNATAVHMYQRAGFNEIGHRPNYYPARDGREDALLMAYTF